MTGFLNCRECVELLMDYLEGNLDQEMYAKLEEHFSACPPCVNFLNSYRACAQIGTKLRDQAVKIPFELENRLKSFLKEELKRE